jgi:hypothetical protein
VKFASTLPVDGHRIQSRCRASATELVFEYLRSAVLLSVGEGHEYAASLQLFPGHVVERATDA